MTHFHRQTLATFSAELNVVLSIDGLATPQYMALLQRKRVSQCRSERPPELGVVGLPATLPNGAIELV